MLMLFERRQEGKRLENIWMMSCIHRYQWPENCDNDVPEYLAMTVMLMMMAMMFCIGIGGKRMVMTI